MIKLSKEANRNYTAKVVQLKGLKPHSNADRLQVCTIDFQQVITGLDAKEGDLYIYFPVECAINADFLSSTNAFREKELNKDKNKIGFFEKNCRVKAMRLRGEVSNGYIVPFKDVGVWAYHGIEPVFTPENIIGIDFDIINGKEICKKYFPKIKQSQSKDKQGKKPTETKLIDGQFRFHIDTENLRRNADKIFPEDLISVTYKYHGTNAVFSNIITKKKLSWKDKLAKKLGVNASDTEYDFVYSSRRVVKNPEIKEDANHFYGTDIWGRACNKFELEKIVPKGITIYFEIVGYTPDGGYIQQKYDYGYKQGQLGIVIFRATFTNADGEVFEFSRPQLEEFCNKYELPISKSFFYGKAKDMYPELDSEISIEQWQSKFIEKLEKDYNEKDCFVCKNKVPEEGIVVRKEKLYSCESYKLKSFRFLEYEGKLVDKKYINIEDEN